MIHTEILDTENKHQIIHTSSDGRPISVGKFRKLEHPASWKASGVQNHWREAGTGLIWIS